MIESLEYARRHWWLSFNDTDVADYPESSPVLSIGPEMCESILDASNRDAILELMKGFPESDWTHSSRLLIAKDGTEAASEMRAIEKKLSDYPVLDDDDFSQREFDAWNEAFDSEWRASWLRDSISAPVAAAIRAEIASALTEQNGYDLDGNYPDPLPKLRELYPWAIEPDEPTIEEMLKDPTSEPKQDAIAIIAASMDKYHALDVARLIQEELS